MIGSVSGPGSTFKAFLGSARVRVPLSNKIQVGSVQHIYRSLQVRVQISGHVKTSTLDSFFPLVALVRLTFSVGRNFFFFFLIQHLINKCMLMNLYIVTKVFNIKPVLFHQYYLWFKLWTGIPFFAFTFKFAILVSRFTRKDNCLFCFYLYTFHFKTKTKDGFIVILN